MSNAYLRGADDFPKMHEDIIVLLRHAALRKLRHTTGLRARPGTKFQMHYLNVLVKVGHLPKYLAAYVTFLLLMLHRDSTQNRSVTNMVPFFESFFLFVIMVISECVMTTRSPCTQVSIYCT